MHSEVLTLTAEWLPQIMATLLSERALPKDAKKRAIDVEEIVATLLSPRINHAACQTRAAACYSQPSSTSTWLACSRLPRSSLKRAG
jgi:hypothetical protein